MENKIPSQKYARLIFINNVYRKEIGTVSYRCTDNGLDIFPQIRSSLEKFGHPYSKTQGNLYIVANENWIPFSASVILDYENIVILYSEIVAPQSAAFFDENDGVVFFFHPDEQNHQHFPHVHAMYSGDEISIYLRDFHVVGHMKARQKEKSAIKYAKKHADKFLDAWEHWACST